MGRDSVVAIHGDGGYGSVDISNGVHIASPVDKPPATALWHGLQVDYGSLVEGKSPLSRNGYQSSVRARDG